MKNKDKKKQSISLLVLGVATLCILISRILNLKISDILMRVAGVIDLVALPLYVYYTVKCVKNSSEKSV